MIGPKVSCLELFDVEAAAVDSPEQFLRREGGKEAGRRREGGGEGKGGKKEGRRGRGQGREGGREGKEGKEEGRRREGGREGKGGKEGNFKCSVNGYMSSTCHKKPI